MNNWLALLIGLAVGLGAFLIWSPAPVVVTVQNEPIDITIRTVPGDVTLHASGIVTYPDGLDETTMAFWDVVQANAPTPAVVIVREDPIDISIRTSVGEIILHADGTVTYPIEDFEVAVAEFWPIIQFNIWQALAAQANPAE